MEAEELTQEQKMENRERFKRMMESRGKLGVPFIPGEHEHMYAARCHQKRMENGNK